MFKPDIFKVIINEGLAYLKGSKLKRLLETQLSLRPYLEGVPYWVAAAIVGLVAVIYSEAFSQCIQIVFNIYDRNPRILFLTSPFFFFLSTWLVVKVAPAAGGTGIPSVIRALNMDLLKEKSEIDQVLSLKVFFVILGSSLCAVLGAGSLGREGPVVHLSACLFYFVARHSTRLAPYTEHRSWIIAGGAAGVAAAFNAPLAGVVFVLEELAHQHFHQFKTVVISSAIIGGVFSQWLSGRYLYFGYPKIAAVSFNSLPWAVLVGVSCALVAYPFHRLLQVNWRERFPNLLNTQLKLSVLVGLAMAFLANYVDKASIGGGTAVVQHLLFEGGQASWSMVVSRFLGTLISHLSGCVGGFLAPALGLGAAIGSIAASLTDYSSPNLLVMVGMAAFLSAMVRAPFTAWVVVMEMTDRHQAIFPLMLASIVSHGMLGILLSSREKKQPG